MKMTMYKRTLPVMSMDLDYCISSPVVRDVEIYKQHDLPFSKDLLKLKREYPEINERNLVTALLMEWLACRCIPDSRVNLDAFLLTLFHLPRHHYGRMRGYQHFAAMLSYYASGEDDYFITPNKPEIVSLCLQDRYFKNLYFFVPADFAVINEMKREPDLKLREFLLLKRPTDEVYEFNGFLPTVDLTIHTKEKAYWDEVKKEIIKDSDMITHY